MGAKESPETVAKVTIGAQAHRAFRYARRYLPLRWSERGGGDAAHPSDERDAEPVVADLLLRPRAPGKRPEGLGRQGREHQGCAGHAPRPLPGNGMANMGKYDHSKGHTSV